MNLRKCIASILLRLRGTSREWIGSILRDPLIAFRGQQDLLKAKLARGATEDSYLGPAHRPPVRRVTLRLVAAA